MRDDERKLLHMVMERLEDLPAALRQTLIDHQWASIAQDNWEYAYVASQPANTPLAVQPKTAVLFRVTAIVASIPAGATGLVQLSDMTIPIGAGLSVMPFLRVQLNAGSTRTITATTQGPVFLLLSGEQLPAEGVISGR